MSSIKVFHGTRSVDAPRLCDSCENGLITRGAADSEERVFCLRMKQRLTMRVTECNQFEDRGQPQLWALKEIAWILHVDSKRKPIGFLPAREWLEQNDDEDVLPGYL